MNRWAAWVEHMLPPGLDEETLPRARFFVRAWSVSFVMGLVSSVMYVLMGSWSQVAITVPAVATGPVLLWLHRRGVRFAWLGHATLVAASVMFGFGTLAQRPADYTGLSQLLLIPILAGFMLGHAAARRWSFAMVVFASGLIVAADRGLTYDFADPSPTVSHVVNFAIALVLAWLFAKTFDDVRTQAIERLRELGRARSAFLANISHEIRTPMNGVIGMTEVMLLDELTPKHREQLGIIQRSGRTLVSLINDLLDVSKMEAGKLTLERSDFDLGQVLVDLQGLLDANAKRRGLRLVVTKGDDVPRRLNGDGLRLSQVLTNLVSNAIKFTEAGKVSLEVTRRPSPEGEVRCAFSVTDTGVGIAPDVLPRLFAPFEQGDSSTTRRYGGTGLGLALSQQLVALMGGHIAATSQLGVGSRFTFELSFGPAHEGFVDVPSERAPGTTARRSVLVVDDNPVNLTVAISLVEKAGFAAQGAVNGADALDAIQRGDFALVLMDCHMPEMDGFEATERIRALEGKAGRIPIVALTASAMPEELAACRRVGMSSVLTKPLTFAALREVLQQQAAH